MVWIKQTKIDSYKSKISQLELQVKQGEGALAQAKREELDSQQQSLRILSELDAVKIRAKSIDRKTDELAGKVRELTDAYRSLGFDISKPVGNFSTFLDAIATNLDPNASNVMKELLGKMLDSGVNAYCLWAGGGKNFTNRERTTDAYPFDYIWPTGYDSEPFREGKSEEPYSGKGIVGFHVTKPFNGTTYLPEVRIWGIGTPLLDPAVVEGWQVENTQKALDSKGVVLGSEKPVLELTWREGAVSEATVREVESKKDVLLAAYAAGVCIGYVTDMRYDHSEIYYKPGGVGNINDAIARMVHTAGLAGNDKIWAFLAGLGKEDQMARAMQYVAELKDKKQEVQE